MNVNNEANLKIKHQYVSSVPWKFFPISKIPKTLLGQETSELMWFFVNKLWLRSSRLRHSNEPSKISTLENPDGDSLGVTASIHEIAEIYKTFFDFNSEPVLINYERLPGEQDLKMIVYEGRHRVVGSFFADRKFILGRQIGSEHSTVLSQKSPSNLKYFNKPIFSMSEFSEMFKNDRNV